jgi:hypothetical protein
MEDMKVKTKLVLIGILLLILGGVYVTQILPDEQAAEKRRMDREELNLKIKLRDQSAQMELDNLKLDDKIHRLEHRTQWTGKEKQTCWTIDGQSFEIPASKSCPTPAVP